MQICRGFCMPRFWPPAPVYLHHLKGCYSDSITRTYFALRCHYEAPNKPEPRIFLLRASIQGCDPCEYTSHWSQNDTRPRLTKLFRKPSKHASLPYATPSTLSIFNVSPSLGCPICGTRPDMTSTFHFRPDALMECLRIQRLFGTKPQL